MTKKNRKRAQSKAHKVTLNFLPVGSPEIKGRPILQRIWFMQSRMHAEILPEPTFNCVRELVSMLEA